MTNEGLEKTNYMIKKIWNDPVGSQVIGFQITELLPSIGLLIYSLAVRIPYLKIWTSLYETKISIVYVVLVFGILLILRGCYKRATNNTSPAQNQISTPNYTRDKFGLENLTWDWEYRWDNSKNAFSVENLTPLCPTCQTRTTLFLTNYTNTASCSKCRLEGDEDSFTFEAEPNDVLQAILRREKGEEEKQL